MNVSIGYISGPLRVSLASKPEMRDGGSFYSYTVRGTTAKGDVFSMSVYSEAPIELSGEAAPSVQADLPWE